MWLHGKFHPGVPLIFAWERKRSMFSPTFLLLVFPKFLRESGFLATLILQLHCLLYLYVTYRYHVNEKLVIYYATKQCVVERKAKYMMMRKRVIKKRSKWTNHGRTGGRIWNISIRRGWEFCRSKERFTELCKELRPYIYPGISPDVTLPLEETIWYINAQCFINTSLSKVTLHSW